MWDVGCGARQRAALVLYDSARPHPLAQTLGSQARVLGSGFWIAGATRIALIALIPLAQHRTRPPAASAPRSPE